MYVAICDDEASVHQNIKELLNEYSALRGVNILSDRYYNGQELIRSRKEYDIVFMDYQMEKIDGIETSRLLRKANRNCIIIFVSAYMEAAVASHEVGTFRFLLKPIDKMKMFDALDDYIKSIDHDQFIVLNTHEATWKIKLSDIIYAEAKGKHTVIRTVRSTYEIARQLKDIEKLLPQDKFFRCQRSYVAGFAHVVNHTNYQIIFDNNEKAQIGRMYSVRFREAFQKYIIKYNLR